MGCEEGFCFNKNTLSRDYSSGSSRVYYYRNAAEGIPFQWEMQPGTPKEPPREEAIPPLSPPPALLSLTFPKPRINEDYTTKSLNKPPSNLSFLKFWIKKFKKTASRIKSSNNRSCYENEQFEFGSFDDSKSIESVSACSYSSSSSPSSCSPPLSFSNGFSRDSSRLQSPVWDHPNRSTSVISCSPWNLSSALARLAKRVDK